MPSQLPRPRSDLLEPAPPSFLWATWTDGLLIECLARLFVSGIYVEVRIDGLPMVGRTFTMGDDAIGFSEQQRQLWVERNRQLVSRPVAPDP